MKKIIIGIDPGTKTGFAVWNKLLQEFMIISSGTAVEVENYILWHFLSNKVNVFLKIEDARQRKWYGANADAKRQGAGSAKRDSSRWEEFCKFHDIPYEMIHPIKGCTKLDKKQFKKMTGWAGRTNEHGRDAAMMVYGM